MASGWPLLVAIVCSARLAAAAPTSIRIIVDPAVSCPGRAELERAIAGRLPAQYWLPDGPEALALHVEAAGSDCLRVSLTDGTAEVERMVKVDRTQCQAVADSIVLLAQAWIEGHTWWSPGDPSDGPLRPRTTPPPSVLGAPPSVLGAPPLAPASVSAPSASAAPASGSTATTLVRTAPPPRSQFGLTMDARVGVAFHAQHFQSNSGAGAYNYDARGAYDVRGEGVAVVTSIGYSHAVGRFHFGVDSRYAYTGQGAASGQGVNVDVVQTNSLDAGLFGGVHARALGGLHASLRAGVAYLQTTPMQTRAWIQLAPGGGAVGTSMIPSDEAYGLALGGSVDAPALLHLGSRALALHLEGGAVTPATRVQTIGLEEGARSSTFGVEVGGSLSLELYKGLGLRAAYGFQGYFTHFEGQGSRDPTSTQADLASSQHLITVGFAYSLHPYR